MVSSGLNLTGNVSLNAEPAIRAAQSLGQRLRTLSENSRVTTATLQGMAKAGLDAAKAADVERTSLVRLATAQARINTLQKESAAKVGLTNARTAAVTGGANNAEQVAAGRTALTNARAQTEAVRQRILTEQQEGRVLLNNARIAESASRTRISAARLQMQQDAAASAAGARAANQARESLAVTRGALSSLGASFTRVGTVGAALFIGMAANAIIMDRQFANVVRTSDILDTGLSKLAQNNAISSLRLQFDALASELPISYKQLTEIGAAANQLGVSHSNLASFTKTVAQFAATTGVSIDTASTAFGRLDSLVVDVVRKGKLVGGVDHDYQGLADSINKVGVNSVATDQQIINVATQISGIANAAGLGYKDIIGFSGALASVNVSPYLSRGLTTRLFTDISNAVNTGGSDLTKFAVVAGMSANQFAEAWKSDPKTAIINLFDGIRASGGNAVEVLKNLGIHSVLDQPAIVRLANAADKYGKSADGASRSGGILRQTFQDAATAAGENARQYAVISNTVQARLQVALNRVQILFRNIGEANLGPLGAMIDSISSSALKLSQNLDKPFKLLGSLDFGVTNGQLIGFAVNTLGIVAALALLGGVTAKVGAGLIALKQAYVGIRTYIGSTSASMDKYSASTTEAAIVTERLTLASNALAESQARTAAVVAASAAVENRSLVVPMGLGGKKAVNYQTGLSNVTGITKANSAFAQGNIIARAYNATVSKTGELVSRMGTSYTAAVGRMQASSNGFVRGLGTIGTAGTGAFAKLNSAANGFGNKINSIGRGVGNFLGGPLGIVTMGALGIGVISSLRDAYRSLGTTAEQASVSIAKITAAGGSGNSILGSIKTNQAAPLITLFSGPQMGSFVSGTKQFQQGLQNLGSGGAINDVVQQFATLGQDKTNFEDFTAGLDKLDAGFKQLSDSGNAQGALQGIQKVFSGATNTQITNGLAHMGNAMSIVQLRLTEMGKSTSTANVIKAIRGELDGFTSSSTKAAAQSTALVAAFNGDASAAQDYLNAIQAASDASVNLNTAWTNASKIKGGNPFDNFIKTAKQDYQDFVDFQKNILIVSQATGASLSELGALDPHILAGAVKGGIADEKKLAEVLRLKDARDAFNTAISQIGNNEQLKAAFASLGPKAQQAVADSLSKGSSIPDAFRAAGKAGIDAFNKTVSSSDQKIKLQVDDKAITNDLANLSTKSAKALSIKILGDAAPAIRAGASAAEIISSMRAIISADANTILAQRKGETVAAYVSRLKSTLTIFGDAGPAISKGDSAATIIGKLQARILIDADTHPAQQSGAQVAEEITHLRTQLLIKGNPIPAQKAGESAAEYVARLHAMLVVDANTALAKLKGKDAVTQISELKGILKIFGDDAPARNKGESVAAYIDRLKGMIQVYADATPAQKTAAAQAHEISTLKSTIRIYGDSVPAQKKGEDAAHYINRLKGIVKIDASPTQANSKLNAFRVKTNNTTGVLKIDGNPAGANSKLSSTKSRVNGTTGTMKIDGNNGQAISKANQAKSHGDSLTAHINVSAATGAANAAIDYAARDRYATIHMNQQLYSLTGHMATGGPVRGAGSGTSDSIPAMLSNGEYVIRAAQARRFRSLLDNINYAGVAHFASGGHVSGGSAHYNNAGTTQQTSAFRYAQGAGNITELSPYDRHLLQVIADNIGVTITPDYIAGATTNVHRTQARRGNG